MCQKALTKSRLKLSTLWNSLPGLTFGSLEHRDRHLVSQLGFPAYLLFLKDLIKKSKTSDSGRESVMHRSADQNHWKPLLCCETDFQRQVEKLHLIRLWHFFTTLTTTLPHNPFTESIFKTDAWIYFNKLLLNLDRKEKLLCSFSSFTLGVNLCCKGYKSSQSYLRETGSPCRSVYLLFCPKLVVANRGWSSRTSLRASPVQERWDAQQRTYWAEVCICCFEKTVSSKRKRKTHL